jgi:hypothetical protein
MVNSLRRHLTYANVVATLALFVALGGSSYAAIKVTGKNVKNSSLTGADVRNNSLTGKDIKLIKSGDVSDGSLLAKDFKAGQLPTGPKGDKGQTGDQGPAGPSDAYEGHQVGVPAPTRMAVSKSVPAGNYLVFAKAALSGGSGGLTHCDIDVDGNTSAPLDSVFGALETSGHTQETLTGIAVAQLSAPAALRFDCTAGPDINQGHLTAIKVSTVH